MRAPRHHHHLKVARRTWCTHALPPSTPPTPTHVRVARLCTHLPCHHLQVSLTRAQMTRVCKYVHFWVYVRVPTLTTPTSFFSHPCTGGTVRALATTTSSSKMFMWTPSHIGAYGAPSHPPHCHHPKSMFTWCARCANPWHLGTFKLCMWRAWCTPPHLQI